MYSKSLAYKKFCFLGNFLISRLRKQKVNIIGAVEREVRKKNVKKEKIFVKNFLTPVIKEYFNKENIEVIVEGVNNKGETKFKRKFFGSNPAVDFLFQKEAPSLFPSPHIIPFPLETVGEVKFGKLKFRSFINGLGQIIGYLRASKVENNPKVYGYYIFFNTNLNRNVSEIDVDFLRELWDKENIFVVIL